MLGFLITMLMLCASSDSTVSRTGGRAASIGVYTPMTQAHIDSLLMHAAWEVKHPCTASTIIEIRRYTHSDFVKDSVWRDTVCSLIFHEGAWRTESGRVYYPAQYHVQPLKGKR